MLSSSYVANPAGSQNVIREESDELPAPRLKPDASRWVWVERYTDFKLYDICEPGQEKLLNMNAAQSSAALAEDNCRFLTKRLWGAANELPFWHDGRFTTMRGSLLAHSGEPTKFRLAFQALPSYEQDALIEFLKTLQVFPPGTKDRIVDDTYHARDWPPQVGAQDRLVTEHKK
jgi:hypothetical protein